MKRREFFLKLSPASASAVALWQPARADRFFQPGLIPKPVVVREAVWKPVRS